jgi:nicotinamidase-related amidase
VPTRARIQSPLAEERASAATALLVIDMISEWSFDGARPLLAQAATIAPRIAALTARCRAAGVPVIYANDNRGQWRSDFRQVVEHALAAGGAGARIADQLAPHDDDYFVLKPKHSAFFATPMELLLQHLEVRRLLLAGVACDQCVMATASDARMRDYEVMVPRDCVASPTVARNRRALEHLEQVMQLRTTASPRVRLRDSASD